MRGQCEAIWVHFGSEQQLSKWDFWPRANFIENGRREPPPWISGYRPHQEERRGNGHNHSSSGRRDEEEQRCISRLLLHQLQRSKVDLLDLLQSEDTWYLEISQLCIHTNVYYDKCSRGRVVKALDLKSNGVSPRRFESCRLRTVFFSHFRWIFYPRCEISKSSTSGTWFSCNRRSLYLLFLLPLLTCLSG